MTNNELDWLGPIAAGIGALLVGALALLGGKAPPGSPITNTTTFAQPSSTPVKKPCGCGAKK